MSDGMFLSIFKEIAKEYPEIEGDDKIIDNTCMQLVMNPGQFDVILTENMRYSFGPVQRPDRRPGTRSIQQYRF